MNKPDLKLLGIAHLDGRPLACTECGNTLSLEVHKRGLFETGPAWVACLACGHGDDSHPVTNGLVDAVLARWVQRQTDADRDVFTAAWRGTVLAGELVPTADVYQVLGAARTACEAARPHVKRWWGGKKRAAKERVKAPLHAARKQAAGAAATAKVAALSAAWTVQTGGAGAAPPKKTGSRCKVKGCKKGWLTITTRVHSSTGKARDMRVRCAVCRRAE